MIEITKKRTLFKGHEFELYMDFYEISRSYYYAPRA